MAHEFSPVIIDALSIRMGNNDNNKTMPPLQSYKHVVNEVVVLPPRKRTIQGTKKFAIVTDIHLDMLYNNIRF